MGTQVPGLCELLPVSGDLKELVRVAVGRPRRRAGCTSPRCGEAGCRSRAPARVSTAAQEAGQVPEGKEQTSC